MGSSYAHFRDEVGILVPFLHLPSRGNHMTRYRPANSDIEPKISRYAIIECK